ncbi:EamA family transporter [Adlercreutzia sp. ZJ138]|uniref:EamA family transporter n=1 Tax=Adlercreutzia sp. ZJ138 TaxID=2709405 RepID=UPI001F154D45|nr:EamA family transporter [Adlercreutzia sp. ZJ138]
MLFYALIYLVGVFIASVSQVMLKKASLREFDSIVSEYLNPWVVVAYVLFFITTLLTVYAYKEVPLTYAPILESFSYIFVTFFGVVLFKEEFGRKKAIALVLILLGIAIFTLGV